MTEQNKDNPTDVSKLAAELASMKQMLEQTQSLLTAERQEKDALKKQSEKAKLNEDMDLSKQLEALTGKVTRDDESGRNELSQEDLLEAVATAVERTTAAREEQLKGHLEEQLTKVDQVIQALGGRVTQLQSAIIVAGARETHPDLDEYREDIEAEMKATPGISLEKAYILAKSKRGSDVPPRHVAETERPTTGSTVRRSSQRASGDEGGRSEERRSVHGGAAFRSQLGSVIDEIKASRSQRR
jgi:hypothetical protein